MRRSLTFIRFLSLVLASEITLLDQWSKAWAMDLARTTALPREITSFFNIVLTANRGISFGMLHQLEAWGPMLLTLATTLVVLVLSVWLVRAREKLVILALGIVIGGAMGNIIDRIRLGAVTDFLDFHAAGYHWPAFNLADSAVFVGVVLLVFDSIVRRPPSPSVETHDHVAS